MGDVKALFGLIDKKNKRRLIGAVICCVLSVLCGILPYLGVWGIVTCFLNERTEIDKPLLPVSGYVGGL